MTYQAMLYCSTCLFRCLGNQSMWYLLSDVSTLISSRPLSLPIPSSFPYVKTIIPPIALVIFGTASWKLPTFANWPTFGKSLVCTALTFPKCTSFFLVFFSWDHFRLMINLVFFSGLAVRNYWSWYIAITPQQSRSLPCVKPLRALCFDLPYNYLNHVSFLSSRLLMSYCSLILMIGVFCSLTPLVSLAWPS